VEATFCLIQLYRGPYFSVCLFQANKPSRVVIMLGFVEAVVQVERLCEVAKLH